MPRPLLAGLLALALPVLAACDSTEDLQTITTLVVADTQLSTLEAAVTTAGLADDLNGAGPFTVFAPTDEAFGDLLEALDATPEQLLARADLAQILQLHVASGELEAADLSAGQSIPTLNGTITIVAVGSGFGIDVNADGEADATITTTDIEASNGVVHKINAVLIPPPPPAN